MLGLARVTAWRDNASVSQRVNTGVKDFCRAGGEPLFPSLRSDCSHHLVSASGLGGAC